MLSWRKKNAEKKAYHAGKHALKMGIGGHIHVEVVAEEITFPMGVPSPVTIRLGMLMCGRVTHKNLIGSSRTIP